MGGGGDAVGIDAAAHQVLADGDDTVLGEGLVNGRGTGSAVGIAVELDLGGRRVAHEVHELVQRRNLVLADHGLVQVEEDVHVGALFDASSPG